MDNFEKLNQIVQLLDGLHPADLKWLMEKIELQLALEQAKINAGKAS